MKAKEFLSQRGVPYIVKNVGHDRQAAMEMIRLSGQQGVPVIAVGDSVVVGFDRPRIEELLARRAKAQTTDTGGHGSFGARVGDAAQVALRKQGLPETGAYVGGVRPDSPADKSGLRAGDVITAIEELPVHDAASLQAILDGLHPNLQFTIQFVRAGETRKERVYKDLV